MLPIGLPEPGGVGILGAGCVWLLGSSGHEIGCGLEGDPSVPLAIADETGYTTAIGSMIRSRPVDATTES